MAYKRKRSRSRARTTKKRKMPFRRKSFMRRNIARIARSVVLRAAETKTKPHSWGKTELYHNSLSLVTELNQLQGLPQQGNDDHARNGDSILARGWKVRMLIGNKADRPNVTYRIVVVARTTPSTPGYSHIFNNVSGNGLLDNVDKDTNTILYQKYYKPNRGFIDTSETGAREFTIPFRFWLGRKKTYKFDSAGYLSNDSKVWLCVLAYDAYGTLTTDNIAYIQLWTDFIYKDP